MAAVTDKSSRLGLSSEILPRAKEAAQFIQSKVPAAFSNPRIAIVCGSGLGGIADLINEHERTVINYSDIPHFPQITGQQKLSYAETKFNKSQFKVMRVNLCLDL